VVVMLTEPRIDRLAAKWPTVTVPRTGNGVLTPLTLSPDGGPQSAARLVGTLRATAKMLEHRLHRRISPSFLMVFLACREVVIRKQPAPPTVQEDCAPAESHGQARGGERPTPPPSRPRRKAE